MPLVLDASVCGSWMLPGESNPTGILVLERLKSDTGFVPALWWFEIRNLLVMNERRHRISAAESRTVLFALERLSIVVDDFPNNDELMRLARSHRLTVYDAAYLELAKRHSIELATLDQRLADAARAEGICVAGDS